MDWTTFNSIVIASARAQGPGPAPDTASEVTRAFWLIGGVSVLLLVGITVAMIWFAVRFRRGRARTTRQIKGHALLELAWIIIPTLIVIWMFSVGYKGFVFMRTIPPDARVIEVTAQQWSWSFRYPDHGVTSTEMYVPAGVPIHVKLQSVDVIHSFYIPELRVKEDAVPGRTTEMWFRADRVGDYNIFCAEFCGKDHAKMLAVLHVVEPEQYDRWLRERVARQYRPVT
jgi:cytochrome c oxidase subunit 2